MVDSPPMPPYVLETGAAAVATRARLDAPQVLAGLIAVGDDCGTPVLVHVDEDVVLRFGDVDARAAYLEEQLPAARAIGRRSAWPAAPRSFEYDEASGWLRTRMRIAGHFERGCGAIEIEVHDRGDGRERSMHERIEVGSDEWARFEAAVDGVSPVTDEVWATDLPGVTWRYRTPEMEVDTEGYYAPDAETIGFALDRLIGRNVLADGVSEDGVGDLNDVEELLLAAVRSWVSAAEEERIDPGALQERHAEAAVFERLEELTIPAKQVGVNGTMPNWQRVGRLDLAVPGPAGHPVWVEWKWARSASTLHNSLWDAAKVASGVRAGAAAGGYLLAGAPDAEWARANRGPTRLFDVGRWPGTTIVTDAQSWWSGWFRENEGTYPMQVPTPIMTIPAGRVRWTAPDGAPWTIKLVRVEAPGDAMFVPPPRA
ncbi:MAG: hypothetical protein JHD16_03635 [Solirubrobacteraceae bacterium]|nr:hypothetical protein [Solirubrobacteraceae bacterium]